MQTADVVSQAGPARLPWDGYLAGPENALGLACVEALARGEAEGL
jgi:hypothetical protein